MPVPTTPTAREGETKVGPSGHQLRLERGSWRLAQLPEKKGRPQAKAELPGIGRAPGQPDQPKKGGKTPETTPGSTGKGAGPEAKGKGGGAPWQQAQTGASQADGAARNLGFQHAAEFRVAVQACITGDTADAMMKGSPEGKAALWALDNMGHSTVQEWSKGDTLPPLLAAGMRKLWSLSQMIHGNDGKTLVSGKVLAGRSTIEVKPREGMRAVPDGVLKQIEKGKELIAVTGAGVYEKPRDMDKETLQQAWARADVEVAEKHLKQMDVPEWESEEDYMARIGIKKVAGTGVSEGIEDLRAKSGGHAPSDEPVITDDAYDMFPKESDAYFKLLKKKKYAKADALSDRIGAMREAYAPMLKGSSVAEETHFPKLAGQVKKLVEAKKYHAAHKTWVALQSAMEKKRASLRKGLWIFPLSKATHPEKRTVRRGGKVFQQTFHVGREETHPGVLALSQQEAENFKVHPGEMTFYAIVDDPDDYMRQGKHLATWGMQDPYNDIWASDKELRKNGNAESISIPGKKLVIIVGKDLGGLKENTSIRNVEPRVIVRVVDLSPNQKEPSRKHGKPVTERADFLRWFGDSTVTTATGKPKVVYHGSNQGWTNPIIPLFLTDDPETAGTYATKAHGEKGGQIYPLYAKIDSPLEIGNIEELKEILDNDETIDWDESQIWQVLDNDHIIRKLKKLGYDGATFRDDDPTGAQHDTWAVFGQGQVKSAIANTGKFLAKNPDITKAFATGYPLQGRRKIQGLDISIENRKGSVRSGTDPKTGKTWRTTMKNAYGYIRRSEGRDGDHVDCFLGSNPEATHAYVVHQVDQHTGRFDEDKVMLGFDTLAAATAAYRANYDKGWKVGPVDVIPMEDFKTKALATLHNSTKGPIKKALWIFPLFRKAQMMLPGFGSNLHVEKRRVTRRSGKSHMQAFHVKQEEAKPTPKPARLTPEDDYKQNGIHAEAFKEWFGPWDTDPKNASKVVGKDGKPKETYNVESSKVVREGKPITVYHGTSAGGFRSFDMAKSDPNGLYGPGIYFTEDKEIADSYREKGVEDVPESRLAGGEIDASGAPSVPLMDRMMAWLEAKPRGYKIAGRGYANFADLTNSLKEHNGERVAIFLIKNPQFGADLRREFNLRIESPREAALKKAETKAVYLSIRKPFDVGKKLDDQEIKNIKENVEAYFHDSPAIVAGLTTHMDSMKRKNRHITYEDVYINLTYNLLKNDITQKPKSKIMRFLASQGYDGITHVGGSIMGEKEHRVWIAFDPTQIKAVENAGTFNPDDPDMYKAIP